MYTRILNSRHDISKIKESVGVNRIYHYLAGNVIKLIF